MSRIRCFDCDSGIHNHCDGCNLYNISKDSALEEIIDYLEELKVYKKALELACSADGMFWESEYNDYLREARKEIGIS